MRHPAASAIGVAAGALVVVGALFVTVGSVDRVIAGESREPGSVERGEELYVASCAVCHGPRGEGVGPWPGITEAGEAGADFQLRTGRMPFAGEPGEQALPKPPAFGDDEIRDLVAFVASLGDGPEIPEVTIEEDLLAVGHELFVSNCAPCHGATGNGGAVGGGAIALPLTHSSPVTVAEAMITGPGQMPVFDFPDEERDAIVTYVEFLQHAPSPGGLAIGGIGPVPEGFVAWLVGIGVLLAIVYLIGREWDRKGGGQ